MGARVTASSDKESFKFDWQRYILRVGALASTTKLVALAACCYASADGSSIRPGNQRLARELNLGEQSIRNHLRLLRDGGYLLRTSDHKQTAWRGMADEYRLTIPDDWDAPHRMLLDPDGHRYPRSDTPLPD